MTEHLTPQPSAGDAPPLPAPAVGRTLKRAIRAAWDALGHVCAMSLAFFAASLPGLLLFAAGLARPMPARGVLWAASLIAFLLLAAPVYAGICRLAHRFYAHDEPSFANVLSGAREMAGPAIGMGAVHAAGTLVLLANVAFYLRFSGLPGLLMSVLFLYLFLFWVMGVFYHWPLLVAANEGILRREDGGRPGVRSILRNGFLLALSAPGYTLALVVVVAAVKLPLLISGAGFALLFPGIAAFLTTRATREQLIRFGVLEPEEDPDEPVGDDPWKLK